MTTTKTIPCFSQPEEENGFDDDWESVLQTPIPERLPREFKEEAGPNIENAVIRYLEQLEEL